MNNIYTYMSSGTYKAYAQVDTYENVIESNEGNNYIGAGTVNVLPSVDLSLAKDADVSSVMIGDQLVYTLTASNNSSNQATGVTVIDTLPATVSFVEWVSDDAICNYSGGTHVLNCDVGILNSGQQAHIDIKVMVETIGSTINSACVESQEYEVTPENNSDDVSVPVEPPNTPEGDNIVVTPTPDTKITFTTVTETGYTSVRTSADNPANGEPPFSIAGIYYDITTTAIYSGAIEVCVLYDDTGMSFYDELALRFWYLEDDVWVNVTSGLDTTNNIICGTVDSLSWFGVGQVKDTDGACIAARSAPGYSPGSSVAIIIDVIPGSQTSVYAVEETPPEGWQVSYINEGGTWDDVNKKINWGPFLDNTSRTLTYNVEAPSDANGCYPLSGYASFDGVNQSICGDLDMCVVPGVVMNLSSGWSMISIPVKPDNATLSALFPEALVMYVYEKGVGYVQVKAGDDLEARRGYWILLNDEQSYLIKGELVQEYTLSVHEDGWEIVGGCASAAQASVDKGNIVVIYGFEKGSGYKRIPEGGLLEPCKGYFILFSNTNGQSELRVSTQF